MTLFKLLKEPYPYKEPNGKRIAFNLGLGCFVALFLIFFQPFGLSQNIMPNKNWFLAGFGVVTFLVTVLTEFLFPALAPKWFKERNWTLGRQILTTLTAIQFIAISNAAYTSWVFPTLNFGGILPLFMVYTFSIGFFPVVFTIVIEYKVGMQRYSGLVTIRNQELKIPNQKIVLTSENGKDELTLDYSKLLYLEAEDNYVSAYFKEGDKIGKKLFRSTLNRFEELLPNPPFARCHRSFLVNYNLVSNVTGNAQGYLFHFEDMNCSVPVARKFGTLAKQLISSTVAKT